MTLFAVHKQAEGRPAEAPGGGASGDDSSAGRPGAPDVAAEALEALVALLADSPADQEAFMAAQGAQLQHVCRGACAV